MDNTKIKRLADFLKAAKHIAVFTGAGMSTASGIPDYRSSDGLYNTITSEEVFDIERFRRDPSVFFKVIGPLFCAILKAVPNAGHTSLARLESEFGKDVRIATQNIDGLHARAGSTRVYEVHGTMSTMTCTGCGAHTTIDGYLDDFEHGRVIRCKCGHVFKPDVTFFGESLPRKAFTDSISAFRRADLALVLGSSLVVYPAASLPSYRDSGVPLVIINKTPTSMDSEADLLLNDNIQDALPAALALL